jgi:ubiquinone/menaquinone biosynthesis C-methylase UbiE
MIYVTDTQSKKNVSMSTPDSKQYKEGQRQGWDSVANGWQKWWKITEIAAEKVSRRLIELAEIKRGSRVLDIATGIGEPAITAAKQVGDSGHVLATDISSQMLSIAKQRAISLGLERVIEFKVGDAEAIDLPASTFDAALQVWIDVFTRSQNRFVKHLQSASRWRSFSSRCLGLAG